jgi:hypothetical protein
VDKYPTWEDNTVKPEQVRVVGEDIVPTQEKYTLNTEALEAIKARPTYAWCDYPVVQNVSVHNVALRELKQI